MDPQAAWTNLLDAYEAHDWGTAHEAANALRDWIARGGGLGALAATVFIHIVAVLACVFLWGIFGRIDTTYAPRYSEAHFKALRSGQTCAEVESSLGPPLEKRSYPAGDVWYYSRQTTPTSNYWVRNVRFDSTCRLSGTFEEFYID